VKPIHRFGLGIIGAVVALAAVVAVQQAAQEERKLVARAVAITHGAPDRGQAAISRYGCGGCHTIPGVPGANGQVGPPLKGIASRVYIAGELANSPDNLIAWIQDPHAVDDNTAMPTLGVTPADARDIAAYLYTLK
jgi:cytochrome c2